MFMQEIERTVLLPRPQRNITRVNSATRQQTTKTQPIYSLLLLDSVFLSKRIWVRSHVARQHRRNQKVRKVEAEQNIFL